MQKQKRSKKQDTPRPSTAIPPMPNTGEELGEGNRTAAKRYNAGVSRTMQSKDTDALADDAKRALEGPEGEELREAERKGKQGPGTP